VPLARIIRIKVGAEGSLKQRLLLPTGQHASSKALRAVLLEYLDSPLNEEHVTLPSTAFWRAINPFVAAAPHRKHGWRLREFDIAPAEFDQFS
jgi:hypothetical protein